MNYDELSPEVQEELKACKSAEEVLALAKRVGMPLSAEELDGIAGGVVQCDALCQEINGCSLYYCTDLSK
jgi:hypothetical protein